jgi:protein involved in polysaccharide export with SLBB domain
MSITQRIEARLIFGFSLLFSAVTVQTFGQSGSLFSPPPSTDQSPPQQAMPAVGNPAAGAATSPATSILVQSPQALQDQQYGQPSGNMQRPQSREQGEPVQLTEFQRLVAASVGKVLPIYGANLFVNVPSTFAPVNRIPVTPDYVVGPGDELLIRIWGQVTLDGHFTVDRSGTIYIPKVGAVHVAGISFEKLSDFLRSQISRDFKNFDLNVNMGQLRSIEIFVVGDAKRPGSYTVSSLSTLVNALFSSGGPNPTGSLRNIEVRRGKKTIATFDFYDLLLRGDKSKDIPLLSGDVIYIPPAGAMVALAGSIDHPALYELKSESTVKDVLALSGGLATLARRTGLRIERVRPTDDTRSVLDIKQDETGLATPVADGDILEISPIIDRFKDSVTLRGNVADPRRFAWFPGMRVRDLIPDKEALLTRDYWARRNELGLPVLDSTPDIRRYAPDAPVAQVDGSAISPSPTAAALSLPNAYDNDTNVHGRATAGMNAAGSSTNNGVTGGTTGSTDNGLNGGAVVSANTAAAGASGSSVSAQVTDVAKRFAIKNSVVQPAPDIDWAYAVIQRVDKTDLSMQLLPFNLGAAVLEGKDTDNLPLEPGDVVTIFSKADIRVPQGQQTKFVRLEGEFNAAGVYRVKPGENLRQLVARAGGLTPNAYLYGSLFSRESTRVVQQRRLNEYADDLDRRIKLAEANSSANALNQQDQMADVAALQNAQAVAARLRQLSADGRIVLYIPPGAASVSDIPELPLEDGDSFIVPQVPLTVGVYGAVYSQDSFLYDSHKRAEDYIHMAGGGTRTADNHRAYIIRADGSVESRQFSLPFAGGFETTHLNPGDSIVLPEQVGKRPLLRNLVDIATVVGQFGLGIAAIDVLK